MKAKKVIVTGPESTGKTLLCEYLAAYYVGRWIPEYARKYIEELGRPYTKQDVIAIGEKQLDQLNQDSDSKWVFFDTGLIITKVWLEHVYNDSPPWMEEALKERKAKKKLKCPKSEK